MPVQPVIIQGPAIVVFNSQSFYVQDDIVVNQRRETFSVISAQDGTIDERHASSLVEINFTPVGQLMAADDWTKIYPHVPANIGTSIFNGAAVIHSITQGETHTYHRAGITTMPELALTPLAPLFGAMTITAIGQAAKQPTDTDFLKTIATAAFADATFDETRIPTESYSAAIGSRATPYDAVGGMDGFRVRFTQENRNINAADKGVCDIILAGINVEVEFAPSNLTEAHIDSLILQQGSGAPMPGESISKANEDIVIAGTTLTFTLKQCGAKEATLGHALGQTRQRGLIYTHRAKFTTGARQPAWVFA